MHYLEKNMGNVREYRNNKLVTTEKRRNYLVSESKYHISKFLTENLLAIEMKNTQKLMNMLVYLGLSILDLSKTVKYEFWYGCVKLKHSKMQNFLKSTQTASFFMYKQRIFIKILQKMLKQYLTL